MREVTYKLHHPYAPTVKKRAVLPHFLMDIPYLVAGSGVVPKLPALNERLSTGGNPGGMSMGVTWRPFQITPEEYVELVDYFLTADIDELKRNFRLFFAGKFRIEGDQHA
jgi:hypothetical protein